METRTDFVFVNNESESKAAQSTVRSQARKHSAKQFRLKHKEVGLKNVGTTKLASKTSPNGDGSGVVQHSEYCQHGMLEASGTFLEESESQLTSGSEASISLKLEASEPRCNACGGTIRARISPLAGESQKARNGRPTWKDMLELSPLEFLGAGRVDPFLSYPVDKPDGAMHELMDLNVTYMIPGLAPDDYQHPNTHSVNSVAKAWISASLSNSFLFHALLFTASIHQDYLRCSQIYPNSPAALSHKLIVIRKLSKGITLNTAKAPSDEVILTILVLSSHELMSVTEEKRKPFNSPLKTTQWLNVYGNIEYVPEHMKAVMDLVNLRGGIEEIKLRGLAETIVGGDVIYSLNNGTKPVHPPLHSHETYIAAVNTWAASIPYTTSEAGFQHLDLPSEMLQVLDSMRALTTAIDHYLQGKPAGLTIGQIARTRTGIQKRLLLLPVSKDLDGSGSLYKCVRLTAIIFSVAVIFPIPNTFHVLQTSVTGLKTALEDYNLRALGKKCDEVVLWMLVLGGIAALDKPERGWFVSELAFLQARLGIERSSAEEVLERFLWLGSACAAGGRLLWDEVEGRD